MASYLRLATLHFAAPGVLDVVFGKDGTHEDAPYWMGPVVDLHPGGQRGWFHVTRILSGRFANVLENAPMLDLRDAALDLRVPSVAARLAGLCAWALSRWGRPDPATVWIYYTGRGMIQLMVEDRALYELEHEPFWTEQGNIDHGAFVCAMVLELAPKIAALRPTS